MNKLFVAQAAKEQADRLAEAARMFGVSSSSLKFEGCQLLTYPFISGSAYVDRVLENGLILSSKQTVVWGECTKRVTCGVGQLVSFEGYLKEGYVHASGIDLL